jgi:replication factor C subunit 1
MDIVCTGSITAPTGKRIHKVIRPGVVLHAGEQCNDGRPITESWRYQQAQKQGIPIVCTKMKKPKVACPAMACPAMACPAMACPAMTNQELWVDKYTPSTIADIIGHKEAIQQLTQFLQAGRGGILIVGPPGIGKTTTVHVVARELGYKVAEHNASDTRSVSLLRGMIALGMKRLQKEVVVMDEVDGLSGGGERGGIGELADLIRKSNVPIICIANQTPPKLKPLQNACQTIKFHRPVKSTIATALLGIAKKEGLTITKAELETMCETSGNDIRSILNRLQFDGKAKHGEKDASLRLDLFSATQRLIGNKRISLTEAEDLVYVDYGMVPLMVQEGYLGASRGSLEDAVMAAEEISFGDLMNQRLWRTQDWSLLPHVVHSTVAAARTVQGPAPFQIFPQLLGKNSKRAKHRRLLEEVGRVRHQSVRSLRLYELEPMEKILLQPLQKEKPDIKGAIQRIDAIHLTRDHLVENIAENLFYPTEIPTKVKTAFTREYNKGHQGVRKVKEDLEDDLDDLEEDMEELDLLD